MIAKRSATNQPTLELHQKSSDTLKQLLDHIQQQGGLWTEAGPVLPVRHEGEGSEFRAEFRVKGVFPETWLKRLGSRQHFETMTLLHGVDHDGLKTTPVTRCSEQDISTAQQIEFLGGWKAVILREPYVHRPLGKYDGPHIPVAGGFGAISSF